VKHLKENPTQEPISLEDAKTHLRVILGDESEDTLINNIITAAREFCENYTGRAFATCTVSAFPSAFEPVMEMPVLPMQSVQSIKYFDEAEHELSADSYVMDVLTGRIWIKKIPSFVPREINPIEIKYTAGFEDLPKTLRQAMLLLIGHWYMNREAVITENVVPREVQLTVETLLNQHKGWWF
jgi:uncharacterized phiE125 gp8 family phage protein